VRLTNICILLCLLFQQTKPVVHKLLGSRTYDSRAKRPKLKQTDRRLTVDMSTTTTNDESCYDVITPQTIDEIRRMNRHRLQNTQLVLKPYVGKRTSAVIQHDDIQKGNEQSITAAATITEAKSNTSTSSTVKSSECRTNETTRSAETDCVCTEKMVQYLQAIG